MPLHVWHANRAAIASTTNGNNDFQILYSGLPIAPQQAVSPQLGLPMAHNLMPPFHAQPPLQEFMLDHRPWAPIAPMPPPAVPAADRPLVEQNRLNTKAFTVRHVYRSDIDECQSQRKL
jgi:hypothetical protein